MAASSDGHVSVHAHEMRLELRHLLQRLEAVLRHRRLPAHVLQHLPDGRPSAAVEAAHAARIIGTLHSVCLLARMSSTVHTQTTHASPATQHNTTQHSTAAGTCPQAPSRSPQSQRSLGSALACRYHRWYAVNHHSGHVLELKACRTPLSVDLTTGVPPRTRSRNCCSTIVVHWTW